MESWGISTLIDLIRCDASKIRDPVVIRDFLRELVQFLDMKAFGEPFIARFGSGDKEGYSAVQLIETSAIVCHFDETNNNAYIDIFSCKDYNPNDAADFCMNWFEAGEYVRDAIERGDPRWKST